MASGAVLEFGYGNNSYTGSFQGAGTARFIGGATTIDSTYGLSTTEIDGGTAVFNTVANRNLGTTNLNSGVIDGTSNLTISNLNWLGGGFAGSGSTSIASGTFGGLGNTLSLERNMQITGNVDWLQDNLSYSSTAKTFSVDNGGTLTSSGNSFRYLYEDNIAINNGVRGATVKTIFVVTRGAILSKIRPISAAE